VRKHDIEKETPIMPEVAADSVANKLFSYLYQSGHNREAQKVYDRNLEIVKYLSDNLIRVYAHNARFRAQMKRIKTIDKVHSFMEHWLAGWLKDNEPSILRVMPSGFGWSARLTEKKFSKNPITEQSYKKALTKFLEEEQAGIKAYKKFLLSLPVTPEFNTIRNIFAGIIRDEENHEKILLRLAIF